MIITMKEMIYSKKQQKNKEIDLRTLEIEKKIAIIDAKKKTFSYK